MKKAQEKSLEPRLRKYVEKLGGQCLKFHSNWSRSWPDRFLFLPGGLFLLAEIKTEGKDLTPLQKSRVKKAKAMGFTVFVIDSEKALLAAKNALLFNFVKKIIT